MMRHERPIRNRRKFFWTSRVECCYDCSFIFGLVLIEEQKIDIYKNPIEFLKGVDPGIYIRLDFQLFKTVEEPNMKIVLRVTTEITLFIIPKLLLTMLKEALPVIDDATKTDISAAASTMVRRFASTV